MSGETRGPLEVFVRKSDADREIDRLTVRVAELQAEVERLRGDRDEATDTLLKQDRMVDRLREELAEEKAYLREEQATSTRLRARIAELEAREVTEAMVADASEELYHRWMTPARVGHAFSPTTAARCILNAALRSPATEEAP